MPSGVDQRSFWFVRFVVDLQLHARTRRGVPIATTSTSSKPSSTRTRTMSRLDFCAAQTYPGAQCAFGRVLGFEERLRIRNEILQLSPRAPQRT